MDQCVSTIQNKLIISNAKISNQLNSQARDIELLGLIVSSQSDIDDALFQVLNQFEDMKKNLDQLRRELRVRNEVPNVLLKLFNLTTIVDHATLLHSVVHHYEVMNDTLNIKSTLLKQSKDVEILKADPFNYQALEDGLMCTFKYIGPVYMSFTITPLIALCHSYKKNL